MDLESRRFTQRVLIAHAVVFIVILVLVGGASRELYRNARIDALSHGQETQEQLAIQTSSAIRNHYDSILEDLQVLSQLDQESSANLPPALDRMRQMRAGGVLWAQLENRVDLLMIVDHEAIDRAINLQNGTEAASAEQSWPASDYREVSAPPADGPRTGHREPTLRDRLERVRPEREERLNRANEPGLIPRPPRGADGSYRPVPLPDTPENRRRAAAVLEIAGEWLRAVSSPQVSSLIITGENIGFNLMAVPIDEDSLVVAAIATHRISELFFDEQANESTSITLLDIDYQVMASTDNRLVNRNFDQYLRGPVSTSQRYDPIRYDACTTNLLDMPAFIDDIELPPSLVTQQCFGLGGVQARTAEWHVIVARPTDRLDAALARLFRQTLLWAGFLAVAVTGLLLSTATTMIRGRLKAERAHHDVLKREVDSARKIQLAWLPGDHYTTPTGIQVHATNRPASQISGDFYNWFELEDGKSVVLIGDVTGHGMSAAFLMATTQLLVRTVMTRMNDLAQCLEFVNSELTRQVFSGQFVTMSMILIDPAEQKMQIASAGHPAPLLITEDESVIEAPSDSDIVLGVLEDAPYHVTTLDLRDATRLLLYTDGATEAINMSGEMLEVGQLRAMVAATPASEETAAELLERITDSVVDYARPAELNDDLTLVVIDLSNVQAMPKSQAPEFSTTHR